MKKNSLDAPRVRAIEPRIVVNRSDSAILRCTFDSNPLPYEIIWFKNGYEIFRQNQLKSRFFVKKID